MLPIKRRCAIISNMKIRNMKGVSFIRGYVITVISAM